MMIRAWGRSFVLFTAFFSFTTAFCLLRISGRAGSSHSLWKLLSLSPFAIPRRCQCPRSG
jgi:hypothetical protein